MTRKLWMTTVAVAMAAAISMPLMAQVPQGRGGRGAAMAGPGGPGGPGRGGPMGILRGIQLTDAQRDQIRAIHEEARTGEAPGAKMMELQKQLHLALLADTVDPARLEPLKTSIAAAEAEALARRIDIETRVVQVLTPEQRAQARENVDKGAPGSRRPGPGRGGRR